MADGVAGVQYRCHAALGPVGGTLVELGFADQRHAQLGRQVQGRLSPAAPVPMTSTSCWWRVAMAPFACCVAR